MFHSKLRLQKLLEFTKRINLCNNLGYVREWSCNVVIVKLKTCIVRLFLLGFTKNFIGLYTNCSHCISLVPRRSLGSSHNLPRHKRLLLLRRSTISFVVLGLLLLPWPVFFCCLFALVSDYTKKYLHTKTPFPRYWTTLYLLLWL